MSLSVPQWLLTEVRQAKVGSGTEQVKQTSSLLARFNLHTVCNSARCPNLRECFSHSTATFMILGDICTRGCTFCALKRGRPQSPAGDEPERLAQAVNELGLRHVVITSPTRDDLSDGGACHYARVAETLRERCRGVKVELLVPDFKGSAEALATVLASRPDILAHNLETIPRLYPRIRQGANYWVSLEIIRKAKEMFPEGITKSGIMLGLGEECEEVEAVLEDLRRVGCNMLTLGQYLAPSLWHIPVARYVKPEEFEFWHRKAMNLGFESVAAGSLVRSSYRASHYLKLYLAGGL